MGAGTAAGIKPLHACAPEVPLVPDVPVLEVVVPDEVAPDVAVAEVPLVDDELPLAPVLDPAVLEPVVLPELMVLLELAVLLAELPTEPLVVEPVEALAVEVPLVEPAEVGRPRVVAEVAVVAELVEPGRPVVELPDIALVVEAPVAPDAPLEVLPEPVPGLVPHATTADASSTPRIRRMRVSRSPQGC